MDVSTYGDHPQAVRSLASITSGEIYFRAYYYLESARLVDVTYMVVAEYQVPFNHVSLSTYTGGDSYAWVDGPDIFIHNPAVGVPTDRWFCTQAHVHVDGESGSFTSWVDGTMDEMQTDVDTLPAAGFTALQVGATWTGGGQGAYRMWVDEVALDDAPIPCTF